MKKLEFIDLEACDEAADWAIGKTWEEVYTTCHRGDWLLWLFKRTNPDNLRELTLAKGHCANTVRHLMSDDRSIAAVDAAIAFGEGKITKEELDATASASAAFAYADFYADYADFLRFAHYPPSAAATTYYAAAAFSYVAANADANADAKKENQQHTADICRKYFPIGIWNIKN